MTNPHERDNRITVIADLLRSFLAVETQKVEQLVNIVRNTHPLLTGAIRRHLAEDRAVMVYNEPEAFEAFIRGGGNIDLYKNTSRELANLYEKYHVKSVVDIGCGSGYALIPALAQEGRRLKRLGLIEPSDKLLELAEKGLKETTVPIERIHAWNDTLEGYLQNRNEHWSLAQATFSLQSIEPTARWEQLSLLRDRIDRIVIVEFDVPPLAQDSDDYLLSLANRHERAIAEYEEDRELVTQGFLMPMLKSQIDSTQNTINWESPLSTWKDGLTSAGYHITSARHISDYFWSPVFLIEAET